MDRDPIETTGKNWRRKRARNGDTHPRAKSSGSTCGQWDRRPVHSQGTAMDGSWSPQRERDRCTTGRGPIRRLALVEDVDYMGYGVRSGQRGCRICRCRGTWTGKDSRVTMLIKKMRMHAAAPPLIYTTTPTCQLSEPRAVATHSRSTASSAPPCSSIGRAWVSSRRPPQS